MKTFKITIEVDDDIFIDRKVKADGLGDLLSRNNDLHKKDEAGRIVVIPASKIVKIMEILGKDKEEQVY